MIGATGLTADPILDHGAAGLEFFRTFFAPYAEWTGSTPRGLTIDGLTELYDAERGMDLTGVSDFATALRTAVAGAREQAGIQSDRFEQVGRSWPEGAGVDARRLLGDIGSRASVDLDSLADSADAIDAVVENIIGSIARKAEVSGASFASQTVDGKSAEQVESIIGYARGSFGSAAGTEERQALVRQVLPDLPEGGDPEEYSAAWLNQVFVAAIDAKADEFVALSQETTTAVSGLYQQAAARLDSVDTTNYPTAQEQNSAAPSSQLVKTVAAQTNESSAGGSGASGAQGQSGQGQSGQGQSGQGQSSQGQSGQGQSGQGQSGQAQSGQGQSGRGQSGQGQTGQSGQGSQNTAPAASQGTPQIQSQVADAKAIIGAVDAGIKAASSAVDVAGKVVTVGGQIVTVGGQIVTTMTGAVDKVIANISNAVTLAEKIDTAVTGHEHSGSAGQSSQSAGHEKESGADKSGKGDGAGSEGKSADPGKGGTDGAHSGQDGKGAQGQSGAGGEQKSGGSADGAKGSQGASVSPDQPTAPGSVAAHSSGAVTEPAAARAQPGFVMPALRGSSDERRTATPGAVPVSGDDGGQDGSSTEVDVHGGDR